MGGRLRGTGSPGAAAAQAALGAKAELCDKDISWNTTAVVTCTVMNKHATHSAVREKDTHSLHPETDELGPVGFDPTNKQNTQFPEAWPPADVTVILTFAAP